MIGTTQTNSYYGCQALFIFISPDADGTACAAVVAACRGTDKGAKLRRISMTENPRINNF